MASPIKQNQIIFTLCLLFLARGVNAQEPGRIRVLVKSNSSTLNLLINGPYEIFDSNNKRILYRGSNLNTTVTTDEYGMRMGKIDLAGNKLTIKALRPEAILIDGRRFRGQIQLIKKENSSLQAVNLIGLEDYIRGVLYHEASHHWPIEALKAQAIASRTFAFNQMQENLSRDYDLTSDIYSQVYGGRISERYRTNKAVDQTKNQVLIYKGKIFPTYYHATCAGHTEDASLLWDIDIAPLKGVSCGFCKESPHFNWHAVLSRSELRKKLNKKGYRLGKIEGILIKDKDKSERVVSIIITTARGKKIISGKNLRQIVGPNVIKSTNFKVDLINGDIVFEGLGWGHGVGLCQWGAYFMAREGSDYQAILKHYYPGSKISSITYLQ